MTKMWDSSVSDPFNFQNVPAEIVKKNSFLKAQARIALLEAFDLGEHLLFVLFSNDRDLMLYFRAFLAILQMLVILLNQTLELQFMSL